MSRGQNIPTEKVKLARGRLRALEMESWILAPAAPWELERGTVSPGISGIGDTSGTGSVPRTGNPGSLHPANVSWAFLVSETHFSTIRAELLLWCCFGHPRTSSWRRQKLSHSLSPCWDPIAHSRIILLAATSLPYVPVPILPWHFKTFHKHQLRNP